MHVSSFALQTQMGVVFISDVSREAAELRAGADGGQTAAKHLSELLLLLLMEVYLPAL